MKNKVIQLIFIASFLLVNIQAKVITPDEIYKLAIENSNELKSAQLQLKSKKEDLNQIKARLYPQINFTLDYNSTYYEINKLQNVREHKIDEKSLDYVLSLKQTLYSHETYTKLDLEKTRIELFELQVQSDTQEISKEVLNNYLELLKSKNKIDLLESYLAFNDEKLKMIEKKYTMHLSDKLELLKSQVELNRSKIDLAKEKKMFQLYMSKLQQTTQLEDIEMPSIDFQNFSTKMFPSKEQILSQKEHYLERNLEMLGAKKAIQLSELDIVNSQSAHYPKLVFDARYTKYNSNDPTVDYENFGRFSLQLQIPLYQGGAISSQVKSTKIKKKAALEDLENTKKKLKIKFNELITRIDASIQTISVYKEALKSSNTYLNFVALGYENGLKSSIDLMDAKNKVYEIKYEYIQNIQEFIESYVEFLILTNDLEKLKTINNLLVVKST